MFVKGFKGFFGREDKELTKAGEVYDRHSDAIMHHMKEIHRLTSKHSPLYDARDKLGIKSSHRQLHRDIERLITKHTRDEED